MVPIAAAPSSASETAVAYFRAATQADNTDWGSVLQSRLRGWLQERPDERHQLASRNSAPQSGRRRGSLRAGRRAANKWLAPPKAREKELARRLSSDYAEWDAKQAGRNEVPRGLERIKTDVDVPASLRVERRSWRWSSATSAISPGFISRPAGGRPSRARPRGHIGAASAVYLAPYDAAAHLLLGRVYLRSGRTDEAIDEFKIAIWSDDTVASHLALADAYTRARDVALPAPSCSGSSRRIPERRGETDARSSAVNKKPAC